MSHVSVIGTHPIEFFHHLEAAGYTYSTHKTYAEYTPKSSEAPVAVVVDGSNAGELESTQEILKILETNAILVLFSPSVALLQIVKDAIQSVIDLPKLELIKGAPLIVSKIPGTDYYHLAPPISLQTRVGKDSGDTILTAGDASLNSVSLQSSVDLIGKIKSIVSDPALQAEDQTVLDPPSTTSFVYRKQPLSIITTLYEPERIHGDAIDITWYVWIYAFATDYVPADERCVVTVLVKFGGYYAAHPTMASAYEASYGLACESIQWFHQHPSTYQSDMDGRYTYNINFGQRYNVFEEDGATTKTFDASYNETYTRIGAQSLSIKPQWQEFKVFIIGDEPEVIRGFYVGTCDRKEKFPEMTFSFSAQFPFSFWSGTGSRLPLDFSFPIPQS